MLISLAVGEMLQDRFDVSVVDSAGGTAVAEVTVDPVGVDDKPEIDLIVIFEPASFHIYRDSRDHRFAHDPHRHPRPSTSSTPT